MSATRHLKLFCTPDGDLLTFQKMRQASLAKVSSVSAVGRLEFLGPFRLGLFHLVKCEILILLLQPCAFCTLNELYLLQILSIQCYCYT